MIRRQLLTWAGAIIAAVLLGAAAVLIWAPWRTPVPPMAITLPQTCPALLGLPAPTDGPEAGTGPDNARDLNCSWGTPASPGFPPVRARTTLYPTIDEAKRQSASQITRYLGPTQGVSLGADTPIAGIGDDARVSDHDGYLVLVARKANVVLTLQYIAPPEHTDEDQDQAVLATAARTLLSGITLTTV